MAKATVSPTWNLDDIAEAGLAQPHGHAWQVLKNAAWELWRNRLATAGAVMVLTLLLVAVLAPTIARYDPVKQNYREMLQGPSAAHYFGTDKFGRDIWSRVVWGAQRSAIISVLAVLAGVIGGIPLGTISGYYGGKLDAVLMRVVDAWLAFPGILFYLIAATIIQAYKLSLF
jgi:ABC-type dipeptide/oligopeptide/nickel transport system permease subunit